MLAGHSDHTGAPADDVDLAVRRADAIRDRLGIEGVRPDRVVIAAYAGADPADRRVVVFASDRPVPELVYALGRIEAPTVVWTEHGHQYSRVVRWCRSAGFWGLQWTQLGSMKKFPDFIPPTKVSYLDRGGPALHLRRCILQVADDPTQEWIFDKEEIRIGSMEDNDIVLGDDTVSRYHLQDHPGRHQLHPDRQRLDERHVHQQDARARGAYLKPGCTLAVEPEPAQVQRCAKKKFRSSRRAPIGAAG